MHPDPLSGTFPRAGWPRLFHGAWLGCSAPARALARSAWRRQAARIKGRADNERSKVIFPALVSPADATETRFRRIT